MILTELLDAYSLDKSVLVGYYGGGNYGDELLLEVLSNLLSAREVRQVSVTYQEPHVYKKFHHDFGYQLIPTGDKKQFLQAIIRNRNIIVGGGGLWGLDVNTNILFLGLLLFVSKFILRKKVFLLGVGYYNSTSRLGHISAWLAGKSATQVIARDTETFRNFQNITRHVSLDTDMAWHIPALNLNAYQNELKQFTKALPIRDKTLFITLRRFRAHQQNSYTELVREFLQHNADAKVVVSLMEPRAVDAKNFNCIKQWEKQYQNLRAIDFSYNPLVLFLFFQKHHDKLALIGPQFHIIITAYLNKVLFLPMTYDNKVKELLKKVGEKKTLPIHELSSTDLLEFADKFYARGS